MSLQIEASDAVIKALDKALDNLCCDLDNKVDAFPQDNSGRIVKPAVGVLASATIYFKALRQGHARKKAVRQLGQQLEKVEPIYKNSWQCYRAVLALLNEEPQSTKKPRASKAKKTGTA